MRGMWVDHKSWVFWPFQCPACGAGLTFSVARFRENHAIAICPCGQRIIIWKSEVSE